jgi:uncharacterized protein YecE (DUF72 family)
VSGKQLGLFSSLPDESEVTALVTDEDRAIAEKVPRWIRFGTSSWSFPGWRDIVYRGTPSEESLARAGLGALATHPLFRTVGLDRSYYGPLRAEDLASYAEQLDSAAKRAPDLPPFRVVSKVWDEITTAVYPTHPRYGARAGTGNPHFLDVDRFLSEVLEPYRVAFGTHAGPFVFELTPMPRGAMDEKTLVTRVEAFLERLPPGWRWAFELRNEELFGARWLDMLRSNGAAHVYTYWTAMPPIRDQLARGPVGSSFIVARLMLPPYMRYEAKKAEYAPFNRLVAPQPAMRDDVVDLLRAAAAADVDDAFVLVNNKAEGSSPLTVKALAKLATSL